MPFFSAPLNLPFSLASDLSFLCNSVSWDAFGDVVRITGSAANEVVLNYLSFSKVEIGTVDAPRRFVKSWSNPSAALELS